MAEFNNLSTERFRQKMKPAAMRIYQKIFPGCLMEDLRENGVKVHILDKEFAIDTLIHFPSDQWISIQEKYRENIFLINPKLQVNPPCPDFTQEYKNAVGTQYESPGEWFKLGAQLYFYGWANSKETDFEKWVLIDIPKYKMFVENHGGLNKIGKLLQNKKHGMASFYAFPIEKLRDCFVTDYRHYLR